MKRMIHAVLIFCASLFMQSTFAATVPTGGQSKPYYVRVPMKSPFFTLHLTTLVYTPAGKGPWPVNVKIDRETAHLTPDSYQVYRPADATRQASED